MKDIVKIIRYSWSLKRYYTWTAVLVTIMALLNQATPFLVKGIVAGLDRQAHGQDVAMSYFAILVLGILVVSLVFEVINNIQGYIGDLLGAKLNTLLSQRYYDHILKLPLEYYDNEVAGRITSRLERSIVTVSQLINTFANNFISMILTVIITLSIIAWYAWPVALLILILIPLYTWLTMLSSKSWQAKQDIINRHTDESNGRFIESVGQVRAVKSFVQEVAESRFWGGKRRTIETLTRQQSKRWHLFDVVRRGALAVVFFLIYGYITYQAVHGHLTISDFVLLLQLVIQAQWPLFTTSFLVENLQRAQAGSRDFFKVMETEPKISDAPNAQELQVKSGLVEFKNVSFAYGEGKNVLNNISFEVEPDTKLALVGESGEGKTTITNLLLRFYEPSLGQISIDDTSVADVTQASLRQSIGVVFQEPALFSGTVRENISYGTPTATEEQIVAAAKAANAADFIAKLPEGYDTEIGERGVKLSGGQKQRIAIARAILKDAPILILDEATSSLDSRSEHEVQTALEELMKGRTTVIIAHRLSTIATVDKIVVLEGGKVAEEGSPGELAESGGLYSELLKLQSQPANRAKLKRYELTR
jgi:ATP-binding cassette subfamily B protein